MPDRNNSENEPIAPKKIFSEYVKKCLFPEKIFQKNLTFF